MKNLHRKIGVGILVAGLVLGGVASSNGLVAHGYSGEIYVKQELNKLLAKFKYEKQKSVLRKVQALGEERKLFEVIDAGIVGQVSEQYKELIKSNIVLSSSDKDIEGLKDKISQKPFKPSIIRHYRQSFVRLYIVDLNMEIIIAVF